MVGTTGPAGYNRAGRIQQTTVEGIFHENNPSLFSGQRKKSSTFFIDNSGLIPNKLSSERQGQPTHENKK